MFIFDDPLSALDPEVAEKVFDNCILGMLAGKTRLLVTNQLQCLSKCDSIIALSKHGKVLEQGPYDELMRNKKGELTRLLMGVAPSRRSVKAEKPKQEKLKNETAPKDAKKLVSQEERMTGGVEFQVYLKYIKVREMI